MSFSFTFTTRPDEKILDLLDRHSREISHIYLQNPFSFLKDSAEDHARKLEFFRQTVDSLKPLGTDLVFSIPDTCMGGWHLVVDFHKKLGQIMEEISESGIKAVSVSDPYMLEFFRSEFPPYDTFKRFRIFWGAGGKLTHEIKLRYINSLDLSMVTVHPSLNRNPGELVPLLSRMMGRIEIIVNSGCPSHCGMETSCRAVGFHLREEPFSSEDYKKILDTYKNECIAILSNKKYRILTLPVILPEHLDYYYKKFGADIFHILLPPDDESKALRILEYYFNGVSPENIEDIVCRILGVTMEESVPVALLKDHYERLYSCGSECEFCKDCYDIIKK